MWKRSLDLAMWVEKQQVLERYIQCLLLEGPRVSLLCRDDKWEAGGIKEELGKKVLLSSGVLLGDREEEGSADKEGRP